jgi:hypothetical protein
MRDMKTDQAVDLGKWIGRRQAFAVVAGRWRDRRCRMLTSGASNGKWANANGK